MTVLVGFVGQAAYVKRYRDELIKVESVLHSCRTHASVDVTDRTRRARIDKL